MWLIHCKGIQTCFDPPKENKKEWKEIKLASNAFMTFKKIFFSSLLDLIHKLKSNRWQKCRGGKYDISMWWLLSAAFKVLLRWFWLNLLEIYNDKWIGLEFWLAISCWLGEKYLLTPRFYCSIVDYDTNFGFLM